MRKLAILFGFCCAFLVAHLAAASSITLYNSLPNPTPPNLPSEGYQCCQVRQLGQGLTLASSGDFSDVLITAGLSDWALESTYEQVGLSTGFDQSLTMNLYNLNPDNTVGSLLSSKTITTTVPWRPESDCRSDQTAYTGSDGNCYHGLYFEVPFDFGALNLPSNIAVGLAFNTQTVGYNPTGVPGPYNSLNFALAGAPSVGGIVQNGSVFVDGQTCYPYDGTNGLSCADGPAQVFRINSGWESYNPALKVEAEPVPEPASLFLFGLGLIGVGTKIRRRISSNSR